MSYVHIFLETDSLYEVNCLIYISSVSCVVYIIYLGLFLCMSCACTYAIFKVGCMAYKRSLKIFCQLYTWMNAYIGYPSKVYYI